MSDRVFRKLGLSDLPMVLNMGTDFRAGFICEENARLFLSDPMNWIFACQDVRIICFAYGYAELNPYASCPAYVNSFWTLLSQTLRPARCTSHAAANPRTTMALLFFQCVGLMRILD